MVVEVKKLGFAGAGLVDNVQVFMTSGSATVERNIPYITPLSLPKPTGITGGVSRTKVRYADGTYIVNGSMSFDLTAASLSLMSKERLLKRGYNFPVSIFDGEKGRKIHNCYVTTVSLNGGVGGLVSASVSFISGQDITDLSGAGQFNRTDEPLGYWVSGNVNVRDWSFNFTQAADPVYLNDDGTGDWWPRYIKIGMIDYTLDLTTYEQFFDQDSVFIYSAAFRLTGNVRTKTYNFNGTTDFGMFSHTFESSGQPGDGSDAVIIT